MKSEIRSLIFTLLVCLSCLGIYHVWHNRHILEIEDNFGRLISEKQNEALYNNARFRAPLDTDIFIEAADYARKAVVSIKAVQVKGNSIIKDKYTRTNGSGVIIASDGYIITNNHVIEDADIISVTLDDKREYEAEILGYDNATDLAVLKIDATGLDFLQFGDSNEVKVGEWVLAVGNPFKLQSSVTAGIVSAKARDINIFDRQGIESFIQTDAAINPGNSGGALINTGGYLVGINTAILSRSGKYEGFSFAIPSSIVKKVVNDIREYGAVQRAWLGITASDINMGKAESIGLKFIGGVMVDLVDKASAGQNAGLKSGDVITHINDRPTLTVSSFLETMAQFSPGDKVTIEYIRNSQSFNTQAELMNQLNSTDKIAVRTDKILTDLGFELRNLDTAEKSRLNTSGILVVSVLRESLIDSINMDPSYIITSANGQEITSVDAFIDFLKNTTGRVELKGFYENWPGEYPYVFSITN